MIGLETVNEYGSEVIFNRLEWRTPIAAAGVFRSRVQSCCQLSAVKSHKKTFAGKKRIYKLLVSLHRTALH
jgi:hypothetical protein